MIEIPDTKEKQLKRVQHYIDRMPTLSTTVTTVMGICNNPAISPNDLNRVISLDPVLTGRVLKLINSAYYALPNQITSFDMDNFWTHSIGVGVTAKPLAAITGVPVRERGAYFVAGLLHDLGKIPLNNCFPEEYGDVLEAAIFKQVPLHQTEDRMLEIDLCLVWGV